VEKVRTTGNGKNKVMPPLLYIGAVKMVSATHSVGYERTKIIERLVGPAFKTGQGSVMITLSHKTTKSTESFDDHTFEDEGDASLGKTIKETHDGPKP
jgi:hypothetical protein